MKNPALHEGRDFYFSHYLDRNKKRPTLPIGQLLIHAMKIRTFRVIIEPDENDTFHAFVPSLPGCHAWGDSLSDAKKQMKEAIELYVADLIASGESVPAFL